MYNPFSLEEKTILITGASSGIGRTTAIECSKLGAKCVITGRNQDRLQEVYDSLSGDGHILLISDLNDDAQVENLVCNVPVLNGVVFNAGIAINKPIQFYKKENLLSIFETNSFSAMMLNKLLLKKKKINNGSSLVFTSSIAALSSDLGNGIYGASKAALLSYMKYCARELASRQIRVNAVLPGVIETKLIHGGAVSEEDLESDKQRYPLQRFGNPKDVAYAIIYLLSNASSWVTGTSLVVDGGILLV